MKVGDSALTGWAVERTEILICSHKCLRAFCEPAAVLGTGV